MKQAPQAYESDLEYLQQELAWIEARCRYVSAKLKLRSVDSDEDNIPFGRSNRNSMSPQLLTRIRQINRRKSNRLRVHIDARLAVTREGLKQLSLDQLCDMQSLEENERIILLLAMAPAFSRKFEDLYCEIDQQQLSSGLTVEVACAFLELSFQERVAARQIFTSQRPLVKADLITLSMDQRYSTPKDLLNASIEITGQTFYQLLGNAHLSDEYLEFSSVDEPRACIDQVVLAPQDKERILSIVSNHQRYLEYREKWGFDRIIEYGKGILMLFHGAPGTGKTMTAHAIASSLNKKILNVDIPTFIENKNLDRFLPGLFRQARIHNAVLFFDECEVIFGSRAQGNIIMTQLLTEIEAFDGIAILATNLPQSLDEALDRRVLIKQHFPEPNREARRDLWQRHLPEEANIAPDVDLEILADRYDMSGGYIKNAVLMALASAVHESKDTQVCIEMRNLEQAAQDQLKRPTNDMAGLRNAKAKLSDVVLTQSNQSLVEEMIDATRNLKIVLQNWGIGKHFTAGKGISGLFYGPPGTGKTLCAEAIAGELHRPLLCAHIPSLVSKWVGETESNLDRLFKQAKSQNAVLFFDEADSLLMRRGEGNASRHDDSAVNVLLKLIEQQEGIVLLATNMEESLDPAIRRRLTYCLNFELPDVKQRKRIWQQFLESTDAHNGELDYDQLSRNYLIGGGYIKNAVFKAAFRAARNKRKICQLDLLTAIEEESRSIAPKKPTIGFSSLAAS